ncbi:MAG: 16S rRNA (guanine(966)-N(2))-methyltransferase RsmD [bacterium]
MRIIAGKYKNRAVTAPEGTVTRPILSRVRKSLFDILQPYLEGARVLDLFSGTGVIALEAFSRGASSVLSIDADAQALNAARMNHQKICPGEAYRVIRGDVLEWVPRLAKQEPPFDVIGITPPYGLGLAGKTLALLDRHPQWLHAETVIFVQRDSRETVDLEWKFLEHVRTRSYGRTVLEFFMPEESPAMNRAE